MHINTDHCSQSSLFRFKLRLSYSLASENPEYKTAHQSHCGCRERVDPTPCCTRVSVHVNTASYFTVSVTGYSKHRVIRQFTFCVQHLGDVQVLLRHLEGVVQIGHWVILENQSQRQNTTNVVTRSRPVQVNRSEGLSLMSVRTFLRLS